MRPLSLSPLTVHPCSPLEQIDAAAAAGFERVGLRIFPVLPTDADVMGDPSLQRSIERRLRDTGLGVLDAEVIRVFPDMEMASVGPALEFAHRVDAQWIAVTSLGSEAFDATDEHRLVERLGELAELALNADLRVMLEFMKFRGVATLQDAARIVAATGAPNLGVTIDALHFFRSGAAVRDLESVDARLLGCLQLCDAPADSPDDLIHESRYGRLYPGDGHLPLIALLSALPRDLPLAVEAPTQMDADQAPVVKAAHAAEHARRLLATVDSL